MTALGLPVVQPMPEGVLARGRYIWIRPKVPRPVEAESLFRCSGCGMAAFSLPVHFIVFVRINASLRHVRIGGEIPVAVEDGILFRDGKLSGRWRFGHGERRQRGRGPRRCGTEYGHARPRQRGGEPAQRRCQPSAGAREGFMPRSDPGESFGRAPPFVARCGHLGAFAGKFCVRVWR